MYAREPPVFTDAHIHIDTNHETHSYTQNHTDALTNSIKRFVCNTNIPDINRHRVQTLNISLHVMYAHLCRVHTRLRDTSTFTKKHNWICTNAPTEQNDLPLFIQVCVWGSDQNFNPSPQTHREWLTAVVVFFIFLSLCHSPAVVLFPHISPPLFELRRNFIVICTTATARQSLEINFLIVRLPPTKSSKLKTCESCRWNEMFRNKKIDSKMKYNTVTGHFFF